MVMKESSSQSYGEIPKQSQFSTTPAESYASEPIQPAPFRNVAFQSNISLSLMFKLREGVKNGSVSIA